MSIEDNPTSPSEHIAHGLSLEPESQEFIQLLLDQGYSHTEAWYRGNDVRGYGDVYEEGPRGKILQRYRYNPAILLGRKQEELDREINGQHIYEAVVVAPIIRYSIGTRVVGVRKSMFGLKKEDIQERYEYADGQYTMTDILPGKSSQPAAVVAYRAIDEYDPDKDPEFKAPKLRRGNIMVFKMALPESLAQRVAARIVSTPRYIRRLIEAFLQAKYWDDFSKQAWNSYSGPPWDKWDVRPGGKILYVDLLGGTTGPKGQILAIK